MPRSLSAQGPTPKPSPHMAVVPDTGYLIPPHVMGRNIDNPTEDLVGSGRRVQRPRLGVRVPYRNLTSQIVTQDEIAQEILQRSLRRNPGPPSTEVRDVFFAMKLTQRLAHRLTTSPLKHEETEMEHDPLAVEEDPLENQLGDIRPQSSGPEKFVPPAKMDPALERELALKQLNELPSMKKPRRRRSEPGPADHLLIKNDKKINKIVQQAKRKYTRKQKGEVDRSIQAGPGALPVPGRAPTKRKSQGMPAPSSQKKPKAEAKKTPPAPPMVNGTSQTSPMKPPEAEQEEVESISPRRRSKQTRELDMLLGDEGAVNMIYDAEHGQQTQKRAKVPRRNRQDLKFKARLVRNAVLRLSAVPLPSRSRGRRKSTPPTSPPSGTPQESRGSQEFSFPPKLAEQSRIIRRHSSDSEFSSRSTSPQPQSRREPLTIIPGPRKKRGVPIFVKKVERTYKGKKKLQPAPPAPNEEPAAAANKLPKVPPLRVYTKRTSPSDAAKKAKISAAEKNKLTDEMSRNFQQVLNARAASPEPSTSAVIQTTPPAVQPTPSVPSTPTTSSPNRRRKQELESRPYDDARIILDDDPTLRSLEAQLAMVVGEPLEPHHSTSLQTTVLELGVSLEQPDLFAPSTSSGGVMRSSPSSATSSPNSKQRQSVRQSAGSYCYREINLRRYDNLVQVILTPVSTKMKNALNVQVLRELKDALTQLKRDEGCRVVLLSSTGPSFCQGIDVHSLIHANPDKRKRAAQELSQALKDFLKALAHFSKPLAAAVHGPAVGLGVTMLPFFDMVFASDKATFYAPYAQLGQVPEGVIALTMPSLLGSTMASELVYCCRKLTATEAQRSGLVTRILWPDRFQEELIPTLCTIANQSAQAMEGSKMLLRESLRSRLDAALETESQLLVQHWCSAKCQDEFRALLETEGVGIQRQKNESISAL